MPLIHHPVLVRELETTERHARILTTVPRSPWVRGPLPTQRRRRNRPTAIVQTVPEEGTNQPPSEED